MIILLIIRGILLVIRIYIVKDVVYIIFVLNKNICFKPVSRYLELWLSRTILSVPSEFEISRVDCNYSVYFFLAVNVIIEILDNCCVPY